MARQKRSITKTLLGIAAETAVVGYVGGAHSAAKHAETRIIQEAQGGRHPSGNYHWHDGMKCHFTYDDSYGWVCCECGRGN